MRMAPNVFFHVRSLDRRRLQTATFDREYPPLCLRHGVYGIVFSWHYALRLDGYGLPQPALCRLLSA